MMVSATPTREKRPTVEHIELTDPATGVATVRLRLHATTGGRLRVTFCGPPASDRHVLVTSHAPSVDGALQAYVVRGAAYVVTLRLAWVSGEDPRWVLGTGENGYHHVRKLNQGGVAIGYPSDAALATLEAACRVAADAAREALPWGWDAARVDYLREQRRRQIKAVDEITVALEAADRTLTDTRLALGIARDRLRRHLPDDMTIQEGSDWDLALTDPRRKETGDGGSSQA